MAALAPHLLVVLLITLLFSTTLASTSNLPTCPCLCRSGPNASKAASNDCSKPFFSTCVSSACTRPESSTPGYHCCHPPPPPPPPPTTPCPCKCRTGPMAEMNAMTECEAPAYIGICSTQSCATPGKRDAFYCCDTPAPPPPPPATPPPPTTFPPSDSCPCTCRTDADAADIALGECSGGFVPSKCVSRQCVHDDGSSGFSCCDELDTPPSGGDQCPCTCHSGGAEDFKIASAECDIDASAANCAVGACSADDGSKGYSCCGGTPVAPPPPPPAFPPSPTPQPPSHGGGCPCSCYAGPEGFTKASDECDSRAEEDGCLLDVCRDTDGEKGVSCCDSAIPPGGPPAVPPPESKCPCLCYNGRDEAFDRVHEECSNMDKAERCELSSCSTDIGEGFSCCRSGLTPVVPVSPSPSPSPSPTPSPSPKKCPCICHDWGMETYERAWKECKATDAAHNCDVDICTDGNGKEGVSCCDSDTSVPPERPACPCMCRAGGRFGFEKAWDECAAVKGCEISHCKTREWAKGYGCCFRRGFGGTGSGSGRGRFDGRDGRDGADGFNGGDGEDGQDGANGGRGGKGGRGGRGGHGSGFFYGY